MRLRSRYDLIAFMVQRDLSNAELARWAGCHRSMIGHLRTGVCTTCTPQLAARIEKALGVEPGRLFEPRSVSLPDASIDASITAQTKVLA